MYARRGNFLLAKHEVLRWDVVDSAQIGSASMRGDGELQVRFNGYTLDLEKARLFNGMAEVALRPKSLFLLIYLVRAGGRVVSKHELLSALWPDVTVTEDSLIQCVHEVRQALGPSAAILLRTVPRRGYLFDAGPRKWAHRQRQSMTQAWHRAATWQVPCPK